MMLWWVLILLGLAFLTKSYFSESKLLKVGENPSPLEILKERYARGEISQEEYMHMKNDLRE